jgi:hypothetical protein
MVVMDRFGALGEFVRVVPERGLGEHCVLSERGDVGVVLRVEFGQMGSGLC